MFSSESIEALIPNGALDGVESCELQQLFGAIVREYAKRADRAGGYFPIVPCGSITATDAMIVSSALLKAVNVAVFELGLWHSWGGYVAHEVPA